MKKIMIFGGTFDPPHLGHQQILQKLTQTNADEILVLVNNLPPHKNTKTSTDLRVAMVSEMIKAVDDPRISLCRDEIESSELSETYETIKRMRSGRYKNGDLHFVLGTDSINSLNQWRGHKYLKENLTFEIAQRDQPLQINDIKYNYIKGELMKISSTEIRKNVKINKDYLNERVYNLIIENNLYQ